MTLLGLGAMASRAKPIGPLHDWLVTDPRRQRIEPAVRRFQHGALSVTPRRVVHTSHAAFGYLIRAPGKTAVWAPEFYRFPRWARGAELMFAEAAGWSRPIRFAGGVGGHAAALDVARSAQRAKVKRLVFAHVGRPTIRALDRGEAFPFGELGKEGHVY